MQPTAEDEASGSGLSPTAIRMLAGLESGVIAGLPAVTWLMFHSWLRGEPWWAKLNVAGALFFGGAVYTMGLSRASLAGFALLLAGYAFLGIVFGLLARPRGVARNLILGLLLAMAWQLACQQYVLRLIDPSAPAYFPPLSTLPAQLMFGLGLGRFAPRFQALASDWGDPSWAHALTQTWEQLRTQTHSSPVEDDFQLPFVGPLPEVSSLESQENALPAASEGADSKEKPRD